MSPIELDLSPFMRLSTFPTDYIEANGMSREYARVQARRGRLWWGIVDGYERFFVGAEGQFPGALRVRTSTMPEDLVFDVRIQVVGAQRARRRNPVTARLRGGSPR